MSKEELTDILLKVKPIKLRIEILNMVNKQIAELKAENTKLQQQLKDNTKQVCEKIRKFAYDTFKEFGCFDETDLEHILDQIENEKEESN